MNDSVSPIGISVPGRSLQSTDALLAVHSVSWTSPEWARVLASMRMTFSRHNPRIHADSSADDAANDTSTKGLLAGAKVHAFLKRLDHVIGSCCSRPDLLFFGSASHSHRIRSLLRRR